jgi:hypothetical protein
VVITTQLRDGLELRRLDVRLCHDGEVGISGVSVWAMPAQSGRRSLPDDGLTHVIERAKRVGLGEPAPEQKPHRLSAYPR